MAGTWTNLTNAPPQTVCTTFLLTDGTVLAGVDLRRTPDGSWVCFEVNPSPGFPWYEEATGHHIAEAVANLLMS